MEPLLNQILHQTSMELLRRLNQVVATVHPEMLMTTIPIMMSMTLNKRPNQSARNMEYLKVNHQPLDMEHPIVKF